MGRVMAPWGVKGALKIEPFGSGCGNLCKYSAWWVGKPGKLDEIAVAECRTHGAYLVARFEGCDSPEQAGAYRGAEVALRREDLPKPAEHEFYQVDLIGLEGVNEQGERLGRVAAFIAPRAKVAMRVEGERGEGRVASGGGAVQQVGLAAGHARHA